MELRLNHLFGLTFAFLGAIVINSSSEIIWTFEQAGNFLGTNNKYYWCGSFGIIFGLIQLFTSGLLIFKPGFMKFWCFIHAAIAALAMILFIILAAKSDTGALFASMFLVDFLAILVVVALHFTHSKIPVPEDSS